MHRRRLLIVYGGRSAEHEVSIRSAAEVLKAVDPDEFEVLVAAMGRDGNLRTGPAEVGLEVLLEQGEPIVDLRALRPDVVFPVLHGPGGEDGTFQGYLETQRLPFVGSGVRSSAVCLDKEWLKRLLATHDIPQLPWRAVRQADWEDPAARKQCLSIITREVGFPCFVKPANMGSSVGVHAVTGEDRLENAISDALRFDSRAVIERGIDAREIELAILGNGGPETRVSEPGEILLPAGRWYDYDTKYLTNDATLQIPADLPLHVAQTLQSLALKVFRAADCKGLCRVDFLVDRASLAVYLNEPNTLPGFTTASMYPKLMEHAGIPYSALITELCRLALENHRERAQLSVAR